MSREVEQAVVKIHSCGLRGCFQFSLSWRQSFAASKRACREQRQEGRPARRPLAVAHRMYPALHMMGCVCCSRRLQPVERRRLLSLSAAGRRRRSRRSWPARSSPNGTAHQQPPPARASCMRLLLPSFREQWPVQGGWTGVSYRSARFLPSSASTLASPTICIKGEAALHTLSHASTLHTLTHASIYMNVYIIYIYIHVIYIYVHVYIYIHICI